VKEAWIAYTVHIVELENNELGVEENAKVMNMMMLGVGQEANDSSVFGLFVGCWS
jgi:hypothetical protein